MDIESIIQPLRDRQEELENQIEEIEEQKVPLKAELKTIMRIMRAAQTPTTNPSRRRKQRSDDNIVAGTKIAATAIAMMDAIKNRPKDEEFRPIDMRQSVGSDSARTSQIFNLLREDGMIRFVRQSGTSKYFVRAADDASPALKERLGV